MFILMKRNTYNQKNWLNSLILLGFNKLKKKSCMPLNQLNSTIVSMNLIRLVIILHYIFKKKYCVKK
jgi:hypothetical protein